MSESSSRSKIFFVSLCCCILLLVTLCFHRWIKITNGPLNNFHDTKIQPYSELFKVFHPQNSSRSTISTGNSSTQAHPDYKNNTNQSVVPASSVNFSICHALSSRLVKHDKVLIVGATSFLGSKLALGLHHFGFSVKAIDDVNALPFGTLGWYRWQKLQQNNLHPELVEMSSVDRFISDHNINTVVFIPSLLFDGILTTDDSNVTLKKAIKLLEHFVKILETIRSSKRDIQIVLTSISRSSGTNSIQKAWLSTLELALSSYHGLYGLQTRLIRMDGVYGEWEGAGEDFYPKKTCMHIDKVEEAIRYSLQEKKSCIDVDLGEHCIEDSIKLAETLSWSDGYTSFLENRKDVLLSTYFTKPNNPMYSYRIRSMSGMFMKQWFISAKKLGLNLVIFHDNFDNEFINRVRGIHPNTEFVKMDNLHGRTTNDYRFYGFNEYLEKHPEIRYAVLTDMRDVKIFADPFERMKVIGDYLYVGIDVSFYLASYDHNWLRGVLVRCHRGDASIDAVKLHPFLNAGVLGGSRHVLLSYLYRMTRYFDKTPHYMNCNMGTITVAAHKHFFDYIYSGYPIQSAFKLGMEGFMPQGQAIKHKDTEKYRY